MFTPEFRKALVVDLTNPQVAAQRCLQLDAAHRIATAFGNALNELGVLQAAAPDLAAPIVEELLRCAQSLTGAAR